MFAEAFLILRRSLAVSTGLAFLTLFDGFAAEPPTAPAAPAAAAQDPPTSWIDPDTGHRVIRLTREPDSVSFYFNDNAFTPDGKQMVFTTREGISVLDLATFQSKQVVRGPARAIVVGRRTPTLYYTKRSGRSHPRYAVGRQPGDRRKPKTRGPPGPQ